MNVHILKKNDVPEYAVLPYADYEALLDAAEMASDVSAYRNAKRAGYTETLFPSWSASLGSSMAMVNNAE